MRSLALAASILVLTACSESPAPAGSTAAAPAAAAPAEAATASTAKATKPLGEPLPDGIVPDFEYHALVDMTTRAGFTMRQIHLDLPDLDAETATQRLVAQFQAAGYEASEPTWHEGTLIQSVYSPVESGARGIAVVEYGGAHVAITARDYEADHSRRAEGYRAVLRLQVNTQAAP